MSTVELIALGHEPAANCGPRCLAGREQASARAAAARGFLIQLVACEAQLAQRSAGWLQELGPRLSPTMAEACERLAWDSKKLCEELVVLAYRLVGRWNWRDRGRHLDVVALLEQPPCRSVAELIELHESHLRSATPWLELAALRPIEQMLAAMVPLAIDLAGLCEGPADAVAETEVGASELEHPELSDAARLFGARSQRADQLERMLAELAGADPERSAIVRAAEEQATATFTKVLAECAHIGRELGSRDVRHRHRFAR
ncbi:MAG TPA: hypothetical protein VM869_37465 [Enhygromyxa sp.]|nr:hypothetical protein [Enhygromyxa sp.]